MVFVVLYKIDTSKKDYTSLFNKIKSLGTWMYYLDSAWFIQPNSLTTAEDIYDQLIPFINGETDYIYVVEIKNHAYGWLPKAAWDWINERTFSN